MATYLNRYYYLGPWVKKSDPEMGEYFDAPDHTVGRIDMRPVTDITEAYGFFSTDQPLIGSDYIYLGDDLNSDLTGLQLDAWKTALNMQSVDGLKLIDVLWDTMTASADPEGGLRTYPIIPTHLSVQELHLGGHSLIRSHKFQGEKDKSWKVVQKVLRNQYRKLDNDLKDDQKKPKKDRKIPDDLSAKVLGAWNIKYKISDAGLFIPDDMEKIKAKKPTTAVSDNFNRSNESLDTGSWVEQDGGWSVVSNQAKRDGSGATWPALARYTTALSSDDHWAEFKNILTISTAFTSPTVRHNSSQKTFYYGLSRAFGTLRRLYKSVNNVSTDLDSDTSGGSGRTIKVQADGSTIKYYEGGAEIFSVTDTSISGNNNVGICGHQSESSIGDDFSAEDLVGGSTLLPINRIFNGPFSGPFAGAL